LIPFTRNPFGHLGLSSGAASKIRTARGLGSPLVAVPHQPASPSGEPAACVVAMLEQREVSLAATPRRQKLWGHAGVTIDGVGLSQNPTTELFGRAKKLLSRAKRRSETRSYVMAVTKKRFF
jgi:hypothetical protein